MIYSMYWGGINYRTYHVPSYSVSYAPDFVGKTLNTRHELAKWIKESKDDSFIFIVTKHQQYDDFKMWINECGLEEHIVFEPPTGVTNPNYLEHEFSTYRPGNLKMIIMASKDHSMKDQFVYKRGK